MRERLGDRVDALLTRNAHEHRSMAAAMEKFDTALAATTIETVAAETPWNTWSRRSKPTSHTKKLTCCR